MMRWRLAALLAGTLLVAAPARASTTFCVGEMRAPDCQSLAGFVWPQDSHPTFSAFCMGCSHYGDGGGGCIDLHPQVGPAPGGGLSLQVGNRTYGGEYFEATKILCGIERLYRYVGPLEPGRVHTVVYPGIPQSALNSSAPFTVQFQVAGDPRDATPAEDASRAVDASADASMGDQAPPPAPRPAKRGGCSFAPRDTPATGALTLLACFLGARAFRRRRW
jgi:hypothetical protein